LKDERAKERISQCIVRVQAGLLDGIGELEIDYAPGYRVYFVQRGELLIIVILWGR
jgi:putative addiction module killer protein